MPVDSFESPLTLAACGGHYELAALLLSRGADLEEVNDEGSVYFNELCTILICVLGHRYSGSHYSFHTLLVPVFFLENFNKLLLYIVPLFFS